MSSMIFWCAFVCVMANVGNAEGGQRLVSPHSPPRDHLPPCSKQPGSGRALHQCLLLMCVPRHTTVFAPLFCPGYHSLCANCTSQALPTLPLQDSRIVQGSQTRRGELRTFLQLRLFRNQFEGLDISPLSSSLLFCHKTESQQSFSQPVSKKLHRTDPR